MRKVFSNSIFLPGPGASPAVRIRVSLRFESSFYLKKQTQHALQRRCFLALARSWQSCFEFLSESESSLTLITHMQHPLQLHISPWPRRAFGNYDSNSSKVQIVFQLNKFTRTFLSNSIFLHGPGASMAILI